MDTTFANISTVIKERRSIKPAHFNGDIIPDERIDQLLELADWAPTHGSTEPWRFIVYTGDGLKKFSADHAELYKQYTSPEKFLKATYDKLIQNGEKVSHVIIAIMQRGNLPKVPVIEEMAAVSAAIQNILLGAEALGIASLWSTGGMIHHDAMKEYLHLRNEDLIMGQIFLGYADEKPSGRRIFPIGSKVKWIR
ncbi:nitroreductase [Ferruginibacter lapsinanis]|uniref:nitroreductase family protein n=1 Tax=Ferruginibacter lapsinanis TaxID=563172 RepID=UPI001E4A3774|nr:nitroreductase [Ferruginibacter lapsinanis]UEG51242.1 nitroreductase [Ferruginibacter lapsinanis]